MSPSTADRGLGTRHTRKMFRYAGVLLMWVSLLTVLPTALAQQSSFVLNVTAPSTGLNSPLLLAAGDEDAPQGEPLLTEATSGTTSKRGSERTEKDARETRKAEILAQLKSLVCRTDFIGKFSEDDLPLMYELLKDPSKASRGDGLVYAICLTTPRKESFEAVTSYVARDDGWAGTSRDNTLRKVVCVFPICYLGPKLALQYLCSAITDEGAREIVSAWAGKTSPHVISEDDTVLFVRKYAALALGELQTPEAYNALKKEYDQLRLSASDNAYDKEALYLIVDGLTEFEAIRALGIEEFERIRTPRTFESWRKIEHFGDKYPVDGDFQEMLELPTEKNRPAKRSGEKDQ